MDEDARNALPRALARAHRRRPDHGRRIYKDIGAGIATAGIEYYLPLFFDETGRRSSTTSATTPPWCCTARSTRRCSASGPTRASATASCSTTRERPLLPPEALFLPAEEFFARTQRARRRWRCAAAAPRRAWASARCPTLGVDRGATEPLARLERHLRQHAAPRAARWPKAKAGARACSSCCATTASSCRAWTRWPSSRPATRSVAIAAAPLAEGFALARDAASADAIAVHHRDRALRRRTPQARRRRKQEQTSRRRRADQGPVGAEGRRSGGARATTASAATRA